MGERKGNRESKRERESERERACVCARARARERERERESERETFRIGSLVSRAIYNSSLPRDFHFLELAPRVLLEPVKEFLSAICCLFLVRHEGCALSKVLLGNYEINMLAAAYGERESGTEQSGSGQDGQGRQGARALQMSHLLSRWLPSSGDRGREVSNANHKHTLKTMCTYSERPHASVIIRT